MTMTSSQSPTIAVSWEIAPYLIPKASKGDPQACLLIIKLACPEWKDVTLDDFSVEMLGGGFSGNVPFKCSAKGMKGSLAFKVLPPDDDDEEGEEGGETMCGTAYTLWSKAGIVPKVYLLGNKQAPGIEIYEFVEGKSASWLGTKHGAEFLSHDEDAISFGKLIGTMHSQPTEWYQKYKNAPKPQWEEWQEGSQTNQLAMEMRDTYGDYAAIIVLMFSNFEHRGANMKALGKGTIELLPLLCEQLTTDVMKVTRVGHGDIHGCNLLHRTQDGHGDLVAIDLDFVGYDLAVTDLSTATGSTMSGPYGYFFLKGNPEGTYPSLASRRLVVKHYLESLADASCFTQDVDDVVYDMEIGGMYRMLFAIPIFAILGLNGSAAGNVSWALLHYVRCATNIFEKCKTDADLKKKVIEQGIAKVYTDRLLELGMKPCELTPDQYKEHWDMFGALGPACSGPILPDDPAPGAEEKEKVEPKTTDSHISSFSSAAMKFHESTGADIKSLFDKFDTNSNGMIDFNELLGAAVMCGVGFKTIDAAKECFTALDADGDGNVDFEEFKKFIAENN